MKFKHLLSTSAFLIFTLTVTAQSRLDTLSSPIVVATPPSDAYIGLSKMPNGEIRHYNYGEQPLQDHPYYLSSQDSGFTWKRVNLPREIPYADTQSPLSGEYIRLFTTPEGVYALRTEGGLNGGRTITKIDDRLGIMNKPPVFIRGGKRVISGAHRMDRSGAFVYYSDDDGVTWKASAQVTAPDHQKGGFHLGARWNHGAVEPTIIELTDGRLWMIMRTAQDKHYQSFSTDGGQTWCESTPSPFYGTITMPTFHRMQDGRLLFFWCNTTPLPEMATADGVWDDVFTNRNVTHVAISSDDGKTWSGFRELQLDEHRNASDYANTTGGDKSVHQAQVVEVAPGKILASIGQHPLHRKIVMFDVNWLYEKSRSCDLSEGLNQWSAFRYYKGIVGHCGYNRQQIPLLIQHPDKPDAMAMNIKYVPNDSLVEANDGAVWNFPALPTGQVSVKVKFPAQAQNVDLIINDRWFNPADTVARDQCQYLVSLNRKNLRIKDDLWHTVTVKWDAGTKADVMVDGSKRFTVPLKSSSQHGPSYLHLLGGNRPDDVGVLIESVSAGV